MKKRLKLIIPCAAVILLACVFFIYTGTYYRADSTAQAAMQTDAQVGVVRTDFGWLFNGYSDENVLIFYPGGKVEATAYAPLCSELARNGVDVCLVDMPFRLAFFGKNRADEVLAAYDYANCFIGGHSLGGVFAAAYAAGNADRLDGVVLLAAYSTEKLDDGLKALLVYGSEDGVLNLEQYRENLANVPADSDEYVIAGGNHSQFGSYGAQKGDGKALITPELQIDETVHLITGLVSSSEKQAG